MSIELPKNKSDQVFSALDNFNPITEQISDELISLLEENDEFQKTTGSLDYPRMRKISRGILAEVGYKYVEDFSKLLWAGIRRGIFEEEILYPNSNSRNREVIAILDYKYGADPLIFDIETKKRIFPENIKHMGIEITSRVQAISEDLDRAGSVQPDESN